MHVDAAAAPAPKTESPTPKVPSVAQMAAEIRAEESGAPVAVDEPKPAEDAGGDTADASSSDGGTDATEGKEAKEAEKPDDQKAKEKLSQKAKLRAKVAEYEAQVQTKAKEAQDALEIALYWRGEALAAQERATALLSKGKAAGIEEDPRDVEAAALRRQLQQVKEQQALAAERQKEEAKRQMSAHIAEMRDTYAEQAGELAAKHGVDAKKILVAFARTLEIGEDTSMEEVAETLAPVLKAKQNKAQAQATHTQVATSKSAPSTIKPGKGIRGQYPSTVEGMAAFLRAQEA